ncbi:hypothetical protein ACFL6O_05065 [candidate division KSB1 bacterium]
MGGIEFPEGVWKKLIDSSEKKWNGPGSTFPEEPRGKNCPEIYPCCFVLYKSGHLL